MSAQPPKERSAQLAALASAVEIAEIRPLGFLARLMRSAPEPTVPITVDFKNQLKASRDGAAGFVVYADFRLAVHPEAEPREKFLRFRYTIISRYRVPPEYELEQEVLDLFAGTNGMVHLWPYLRAFVATSCAQLGVIPITLPPFRVTGPQRPPGKPAQATN